MLGPSKVSTRTYEEAMAGGRDAWLFLLLSKITQVNGADEGLKTPVQDGWTWTRHFI